MTATSNPMDIIRKCEDDDNTNMMDEVLKDVTPAEAAKITKQAHGLKISEDDPVWLLMNAYIDGKTFNAETQAVAKDVRAVVEDAKKVALDLLATKPEPEGITLARIGVGAGLFATAMMIALVTAHLIQQPVLNKTVIDGKVFTLGSQIFFNPKKEIFIQIKQVKGE